MQKPAPTPPSPLLFQSTPEDAAFLGELADLEKENTTFKLTGTMTQIEKSNRKWHGRTGFIDKQMLSESVNDSKTPVYYVAGPPAMVSAPAHVLT